MEESNGVMRVLLDLVERNLLRIEVGHRVSGEEQCEKLKGLMHGDGSG